MKIENVFDVYQNSSLGALLLNEFVISYEKLSKEKNSPNIERLLPVLPILFTKDFLESTKGRSNNIKGFYNSLEDNRILFEILPNKIHEMFDKIMYSILICENAQLLVIDFKQNKVSANKMLSTKKFVPSSVEIGEMIRTARKLGGWFSNLTDVEFLMYLNLKV